MKTKQFKKTQMVRYYPNINEDKYQLVYFDSYATEDSHSAYVYPIFSTLTGLYVDINQLTKHIKEKGNK